MELVEVVVYVRDMEAAVDFYRNTLGLDVQFESEHWTTFRTGGCTLALHPGVAEPDPTFRVDDIDAERERLALAGVEVSDVREPTPGVKVFDGRDPDGNRFSLESRA